VKGLDSNSMVRRGNGELGKLTEKRHWKMGPTPLGPNGSGGRGGLHFRLDKTLDSPAGV
jgi:hypothetical protein